MRMMNELPWGAVFTVALGLLVCLAPYHIFPVCEGHSPTSAPMKCFWAARATLGNGGLTIFAGCLLLLSHHAPFRLGVALMLLPVGLLVIVTPGLLIGVCANELMPCHMGTLPALALLGTLLVVTGLGMAHAARKNLAFVRKGKGDRP